MNGSRRMLLLLLLLVVGGGCATVQPFPPGPVTASEVERLIEETHYGAARARLAAAAGDHPERARLEQLATLLEARIAQYEQASVEEIDRMRESEQWLEAEALLEAALARVPGSEPLLAARQRLADYRAFSSARIEARRLLEEARYRKSQLELDRAAGEVSRGNLLTRLKRRIDTARIERLADELAGSADRLEALGDGTLARELRVMANELVPNRVEVAPLPESPRKRSKPPPPSPAVKARSRVEKSETRRQEIAEVLARARQQLDSGLYRAAVASIGFAAEIDPDMPEVQALREEIDRALTERVRQLDTTAQQQYRRGQVREARDSWLQLLEIAPDNGAAQAAVERANKVLENLERLRRQQQ